MNINKNSLITIGLVYASIYFVIAAILYFNNSPNLIIVLYSLLFCIPFALIKHKKVLNFSASFLIIGLLLSVIGEFFYLDYHKTIFLKISTLTYFISRIALYIYTRQFVKIIKFNKTRDFALLLFSAIFGFTYCLFFLIESTPIEILFFCIILSIIDALLFIQSWYINQNLVNRNNFRIGIGVLLIHDITAGINFFSENYHFNSSIILFCAIIYKFYFFKSYIDFFQKNQMIK